MQELFAPAALGRDPGMQTGQSETFGSGSLMPKSGGFQYLDQSEGSPQRHSAFPFCRRMLLNETSTRQSVGRTETRWTFSVNVIDAQADRTRILEINYRSFGWTLRCGWRIYGPHTGRFRKPGTLQATPPRTALAVVGLRSKSDGKPQLNLKIGQQRVKNLQKKRYFGPRSIP